MRLLVLGGTRFLGRAIVDEAIRRGYDVTTFSRGLSGEPRPGAEALHGDRTNSTDLLRLAERDFDLVIDTSVIAPRHVAASARLLAPRVRHYTYVSTLSVYAGFGEVPVSEESPVLDGSPDADGSVEELGYGELKVGCERAVEEALPGRCLIARPGLLVGPHENIGRLPWWLIRIARGGTVVAPGEPGRPLQVTDARDLAAWLVDNTRRGIPGVVNVPGARGTTFGELLTDCGDATAADRARGGAWAGAGEFGPLQLRWVPDQVLLAAGVQPWTELPMWAPETPEFAALWDVTGDRALRTGLRYRPLSDTVRDTWGWLRRDATAHGGEMVFPQPPGMGLDRAKEQEILASLD
jgi:2'-hydroxyisoflavone reductase